MKSFAVILIRHKFWSRIGKVGNKYIHIIGINVGLEFEKGRKII